MDNLFQIGKDYELKIDITIKEKETTEPSNQSSIEKFIKEQGSTIDFTLKDKGSEDKNFQCVEVVVIQAQTSIDTFLSQIRTGIENVLIERQQQHLTQLRDEIIYERISS